MSASCRHLALVLVLGANACASATPATEAASPMPAATSSTPPAQSSAATPTPAAAGSAVFTAGQADSGRDTFRSLCTECHYSSEFSDQQFKFKWSRRTAESLYDFIYTQMPESAPGSLSTGEAVNLVSYILRLNGFEEGTNELPADPAVLAGISLRSIRD